MYELDEQNLVIHLNSFSKVLAPGLRLGWLSATPSIIDQMAIIKQRLDPHTQNLSQFALARFIREGSFDRHLETLRAAHATRCGQMIDAIGRYIPAGALRFARPRGGLYLWGRVGAGLSTRAVLEQALSNGVAFVPGRCLLCRPGRGRGVETLFLQREAVGDRRRREEAGDQPGEDRPVPRRELVTIS